MDSANVCQTFNEIRLFNGLKQKVILLPGSTHTRWGVDSVPRPPSRVSRVRIGPTGGNCQSLLDSKKPGFL